jgi:hypothetical protein
MGSTGLDFLGLVLVAVLSFYRWIFLFPSPAPLGLLDFWRRTCMPC